MGLFIVNIISGSISGLIIGLLWLHGGTVGAVIAGIGAFFAILSLLFIPAIIRQNPVLQSSDWFPMAFGRVLGLALIFFYLFAPAEQTQPKDVASIQQPPTTKPASATSSSVSTPAPVVATKTTEAPNPPPPASTGTAKGTPQTARATQNAPPTSEHRLFVPAQSVINIYSGPGTDHSVIRKSQLNEEYEHLSTVGNWIQIQLPDDTVAWVRNSDIKDAKVSGSTK